MQRHKELQLAEAALARAPHLAVLQVELRPSSPGRHDERRPTLEPWSRGAPTSPTADRLYSVWEEEEEAGLFKADAVNEEDPERDRATQV